LAASKNFTLTKAGTGMTIELRLAHRGWPDHPLPRQARENRGVYQAVDLFRLTAAGKPPGWAGSKPLSALG
jgi:hypothetical protein